MKPRITFIFEEIDYDQTHEYIEIFSDHAFTSNITRCHSTQHVCGQYAKCLDEYSMDIKTSGLLEIGVFKSQGITPNSNCHTSTINANLTITCGIGTAKEYDGTMLINLNEYESMNPPSESYLYFTNQISTEIGSSVWAFYDASFTFISKPCYEPSLSIKYQNSDFNDIDEWIEIYSPDLVTANVSRCGQYGDDNQCSTFKQCLTNYPLYNEGALYKKFYHIPIGILKSNFVQNLYCDNTLNTFVTLRCTMNEYTIIKYVDVSKSIYNVYKISSIQSIASNNNDIRYDINIKFINGTCYYPQLTSIRFQSLGQNYLEIYSSSNDTTLFSLNSNITQCYDSTNVVENSSSKCNAWNECIVNQDISYQYPSQISNEVHIGIIQSYSEITSLPCQYTLNAEIIITCKGNPTSPTTSPPTPFPSIPSTVAVTTRSSSQETIKLPTFPLSNQSPSNAPTQGNLVSDDANNRQRFDYYLILYAAGFILFGIMIAICAMFIYKRHRHRKEGRRTKDTMTRNKGNDTVPIYKSLKSVDRGSSNDNEQENIIREGEIDFIDIGAELPESDKEDRYSNDRNDSVEAEEMYINDSSQNLIQTTKGNTPNGNTKGGLPKISPAISMISLNEEMTGDVDTNDFNNCQQCGLEKEGNYDDNDGLFYCFDCWRQYDNQ